MTTRRITGWHVLAMFVGGFGIIIAVNVSLAVNAVRSFPGLEVKNSYVASQSFDARRAAQQALGWQVGVTYADGVLRLSLTDATGAALDPSGMVAAIGRPTTTHDDHDITFDRDGVAQIDLAPGRWRLDLASGPDMPTFERAVLIEVAG